MPDLPRTVADASGRRVEKDDILLVQEYPRAKAGWTVDRVAGFQCVTHRAADMWRGTGILFQADAWALRKRVYSSRGTWFKMKHLGSSRSGSAQPTSAQGFLLLSSRSRLRITLVSSLAMPIELSSKVISIPGLHGCTNKGTKQLLHRRAKGAWCRRPYRNEGFPSLVLAQPRMRFLPPGPDSREGVDRPWT